MAAKLTVTLDKYETQTLKELMEKLSTKEKTVQVSVNGEIRTVVKAMLAALREQDDFNRHDRW
jgi:sulfur carrier protein ThiS